MQIQIQVLQKAINSLFNPTTKPKIPAKVAPGGYRKMFDTPSVPPAVIRPVTSIQG